MPITNDAIVLGLLCGTLGGIFWTTQSRSPFWQRLYKNVPALALSYFLPALYNTAGLIDADKSSLYWLFGVGATWILIHGALMFLVLRLLRAPLFYLAVGSQANIGAAASAPVVASAFHPSLAPVGVLLAVLGYALGTYAAWVTGQIMRLVATA